MDNYRKVLHQKGFSIKEYIRLYNMDKEEVRRMIKISSYALKLDDRKFSIGKDLGISSNLECKYVIKDEQSFQHKIVIPQLKKEGHEIKDPLSVNSKYLFHPIIDVFSTFEERDYFTEIKIKVDLSSLQMAIGQLTMHYFVQEYLEVYSSKENIYQIAYPIYYKDEKTFSSQFLQFLQEERHIKIVFF